MSLDEYLDAQSALRWRFGVVDCGQFGLGWARERCAGRRLTPMSLYSGRAGAMAVLKARGGFEQLVRDWMTENGFLPTATPDDGDIGLAPVPVSTSESVANVAIVIRRGPWWITREPRGIGGMEFGAIPAWRIV